MAILIYRHVIVDDQVLFPAEILEKHPTTTNFGFDIFNTEKWCMYLFKKYGNYKQRNGLQVAYRVATFGFSRNLLTEQNAGRTLRLNKNDKPIINNCINLFPGVDESGKGRKLNPFGILDNYR